MEPVIYGADHLNGHQLVTHNKLVEFLGYGIHFATHVDDRGFARLSVITDSGVHLMSLDIGRSGRVECRAPGVTAKELDDAMQQIIRRKPIAEGC